MKPLISTFVILLGLLLTACNIPGVAPTPVPLPPAVPGLNDVPQAIITNAEGQTQAGVPGTRCWGGGCVDMVGVLAPQDVLHLAPDETITFTLGAGAPSSASLRALEWTPSEMAGPDATIILAHDAPVAASGELEAGAIIEWVAPQEPGEYALHLMTFYTEGNTGGDLSYGWHILVE